MGAILYLVAIGMIQIMVVFYKPTFIEKVNPQMPVYNEEVFGPVINVDTFDDDEEAIKKADHPTYGLAACIHTSNLNKAINLSKKLIVE